MLHLTVSNRAHPGLELLLATAKKANLQSRVLGTTKTFGHGAGWGFRLDIIKEEMKALHPDTKVLVTDGWDVLINGPSDKLENWIEEHPGKVLFAGETFRHPYKDIFYPKSDGLFPYLNAGIYAGRAADILDILKAPYDSKTDDQGYYTLQFLYGDKIMIDSHAQIFVCLAGLTALPELPFAVHMNGRKARVDHAINVTQKIMPSHIHLAYGVVWDEYSTILFTGILGFIIKTLALLALIYVVSINF